MSKRGPKWNAMQTRHRYLPGEIPVIALIDGTKLYTWNVEKIVKFTHIFINESNQILCQIYVWVWLEACQEFVLATNMSSCQSAEDKLRWAFRMYDKDGSGDQ